MSNVQGNRDMLKLRTYCYNFSYVQVNLNMTNVCICQIIRIPVVHVSMRLTIFLGYIMQLEFDGKNILGTNACYSKSKAITVLATSHFKIDRCAWIDGQATFLDLNGYRLT